MNATTNAAARIIDRRTADRCTLAIAAVKVTLAGLYFMHLSKDPPSNRPTSIASVIFVALLASLAAADVWTR